MADEEGARYRTYDAQINYQRTTESVFLAGSKPRVITPTATERVCDSDVRNSQYKILRKVMAVA